MPGWSNERYKNHGSLTGTQIVRMKLPASEIVKNSLGDYRSR